MIYRIRAPRHQQQPGVMRVLDHQHLAQRQVADVDGVFLELGMQRPGVRRHAHFLVMPGLVPGIYVFLTLTAKQDVDGRDKPGHDGN